MSLPEQKVVCGEYASGLSKELEKLRRDGWTAYPDSLISSQTGKFLYVMVYRPNDQEYERDYEE
tara:strand:- start:376 stop:567 length:192 start_codon:yes stop_codon:yes gene_type:complete